MPGQDGIETILALRKLGYSVPVIAISGGRAAEIVLPIASKLGAVGILYKPCRVEELLAAVRRALGEPPKPK